MWSPISLDELREIIDGSQAQMEVPERQLWDLVRVPPAKWTQHPWGDQGDGFWVVGIVGCRIIWYNDIEHGFNVTPYIQHGELGAYQCNQDELHHVLWQLRQTIETGETFGGFGPPTPLEHHPDQSA